MEPPSFLKMNCHAIQNMVIILRNRFLHRKYILGFVIYEENSTTPSFTECIDYLYPKVIVLFHSCHPLFEIFM